MFRFTSGLQTDRFQWNSEDRLQVADRFQSERFDQLTNVVIERLSLEPMEKQRLNEHCFVPFSSLVRLTRAKLFRTELIRKNLSNPSDARHILDSRVVQGEQLMQFADL